MTTTTNLFEEFMLQKDTKEDNIRSELERWRKERATILSEAAKIHEKYKNMSWGKCIEKYNLGTKFGVDLTVTDVEIRSLERQLQTIERTTRPFSQCSLGVTFHSKKISNKKKSVLEKETCAICLDAHKIKDMVTTKCNHQFGVCCLEKYMLNKYDNYKEIHCPLCRSNNILPVLKYYL